MSISILKKTLPTRVLTTILTCAAAVSWVTLSVFSAQQTNVGSANQATSTASENQSGSAEVVLQTDQHFVRRLNLAANDLVYNSANQTVYASVPSAAGEIGNSLTQINPRTGERGSSVYVGSEPNILKLANDGKTMYVTLDGSNSIRRFDAGTQTPGLQFSPGQLQNSNTTSSYKIGDIAVAPGNPDLLAVARYNNGAYTSGANVAVFDNGVPRQQTGLGLPANSDSLAFSNTASTLYGSQLYSGLRTMTVNSNGVSDSGTTTAFGIGRIKFADGRLYTSLGQVIDPASRTLLGTFPDAASNAFVGDSGVNRAYYLVRGSYNSNEWTLKVYDVNTFVQIASVTISGVQGEATSLIRWGANGLAFRTTGNQVYLIQTSFIPSSEPIPTPTPAVSPTTTATPTPVAAFVRQISLLSNRVIYSSTTQKIYASVPSAAGANGNRIATIEPTTGAVENSVFIGSEPNKIVMASDSENLYVALDGARAIRKFNVVTQAAGMQFGVGTNNYDGPLAIVDFAAAPDNPNLIAASGTSTVSFPGHRGVAIFENGVQRPDARGGGVTLAFSDTSAKLYGGDFGNLNVMTVGSAGVTADGSLDVNPGRNMKYVNGLIYGSSGQVINPNAGTVVGTFVFDHTDSSSVPQIVPDLINKKLFALVFRSGVWQIRAYDLNTFLPIGAVNLAGLTGSPTGLERWGTNGLAFSTTSNQTFLVQTSLVSSVGSVPAPTPFVSPTPTPSPAYVPTFIRRVNLPVNGLVYNESTGKLYASVPSSAGVNSGNTITEVNPQNGAIEQQTFIGSEPSRLALADDNRTMYVLLNGANRAIRRYDAITRTPGPQFIPVIENGYGYGISDIAVMPGKPLTVAVSMGNGGVAIYDDGVKRPKVPAEGVHEIDVGPIEFSDSPNVLYGYNDTDTGFDFYRIAVDSSGLTLVDSLSNLFYGFGVDIKFSGGRMYSNTGRVVDPVSRTMLGTFPDAGNNYSSYAFTVDQTLGRAFFISNNVLSAYDINTFVKIGSVTLPSFNGATATSLVRWGTNGLAFRTNNSTSSSNDSQLYIIQSELVSSTSAVPTGVQLAAATYALQENYQNIGITVTRTGDVSSSTTVAYATADETARAGADYTATSGTLTFAPGQTSKTILVPVKNDNVYQGNRTFTLTLSDPSSGASLVFPSSITVTILDDETRPNINNNNVTVMEPRVGTTIAAFTVRLNNASTQTVTVDYATSNGTAVAGSDYVAASGTLTFNPYETVKTVAVTINADNANETDENFFLNLSNASNASVWTSQAVAVLRNFNLQTARRVPFDFDGDFKADISVFRPSSGSWYINRSSNNSFFAQNFGLSDDLLTPADYDGDGLTDISVFRAGYWYRLNSSDNQFVAVPFGQAGDVPVPADFDGDKKADIAVFRPSNGYWYRLNSTNNQFVYQHFGMTGDKPVTGDFDGDGKTDFAVFRPSAASWYVLRSTNNSSYGVRFGVETDIPQVADFDGDGRADIAVFRAGNWYRTNSSNAQFVAEQFGLPTDIPAAADYDGDGRADVAVFRPSNGTWYFNGSATGFSGVQFGVGEDKPVPSAYVP